MNRLFEIIVVLLEKEKITSKELADHFEVSQRTILRDLDKLLVSGIPIVSQKGYQGGVSLDKSFKMDTTVINEEERQSILDGLRALDSIRSSPVFPDFIHKTLGYKEHPEILDIDLSSWYGTTLIDKIETIKQAILHTHTVSFIYYSNKGVESKEIAPYKIVFKWEAWYVIGICNKANAYRMYKINRMDQVQETTISYRKQEYTYDTTFFEEDTYHLLARFNPEVKFRLIDAYGVGCYQEVNGKLLFERGFVNKEYMITWLLSYGDAVEVLEPKQLRLEMQKIIKNMNTIY